MDLMPHIDKDYSDEKSLLYIKNSHLSAEDTQSFVDTILERLGLNLKQKNLDLYMTIVAKLMNGNFLPVHFYTKAGTLELTLSEESRFYYTSTLRDDSMNIEDFYQRTEDMIKLILQLPEIFGSILYNRDCIAYTKFTDNSHLSAAITFKDGNTVEIESTVPNYYYADLYIIAMQIEQYRYLHKIKTK